MLRTEFNEIIREHFDLSDNYTRKYIASLEESGEEQVLAALSASLYDNIVNKVDDIDFGTIPMSRGDITKVDGYEKTMECLNIMRQLVLEYKQDPEVVDVVISSANYVKDRKGLFIKAYALNVEYPMLMYNLIVLSIERATSLLIATCIEFIKDPSTTTPKKALDKAAYNRAMDDVMFKQLVTFNNLCAKGYLDKSIDAAMKNPVKEDVDVQQMNVVGPVNEEEPENHVDIQGDPFMADDDAPATQTDPTKVPDYDQIPVPAADSSADESDDNGDGVDDNVNAPAIPTPMDAGEVEVQKTPIEVDIELTDDEPARDEVEPENIPAVVPGDSVSNDDAPISEDEIQEGKGVSLGTAKKIAGAAGIALGAIGLVKIVPYAIVNVIIPMMRQIVYTHYYVKMKLSDYLEIQADLLEANANDLEYSTTSDLSDDEKRNTVKKQKKLAEKLRKWSNMFNIDRKQAENKTKQATKDDEKKAKIAKDNDGDDALF